MNYKHSISVQKRIGYWLPSNPSALENFLLSLRSEIEKHPRPLHSVIFELKELINNDPFLRMNFTKAIQEAQERNYPICYASIEELMECINTVITMSPSFNHTELVGCPLNAVLDWIMCVPSGYEAFRYHDLNTKIKEVLNVWASFLNSPESCKYLTTQSPNGWFCPDSLLTIHMDDFIHDRSKLYWGFSSWNDFFTRKFKDGSRPVSQPNNDRVIVSSCESTPYKIERNAELFDSFWIKSQPYSLADIFTHQKKYLAINYVGGCVYQAFLSAYNYHRWHAPVSGVITEVYQIQGTYYSDVESAGPDKGGPDKSQGYLSAVATRMIICIKADYSKLKTIACVFIGMAEVSTCIAEVEIGQHVKKGEEIGRFQFGGSTHCLIFEPNTIDHFDIPDPDYQPGIIPVNSAIAIAV